MTNLVACSACSPAYSAYRGRLPILRRGGGSRRRRHRTGPRRSASRARCALRVCSDDCRGLRRRRQTLERAGSGCLFVGTGAQRTRAGGQRERRCSVDCICPGRVRRATPPSPPADHGTLVAAYGAPPLPNAVQSPSAVAPTVPAAEVGTVTVTGGAIANAERDAIGMRAGFGIICYLRGLATHPDAEGQVTLTIRVGLAGQILGVTAQQSNKVPAAVVSCLTSRAAASQFDPPTGAKVSVTVAVPVTFTKP